MRELNWDEFAGAEGTTYAVSGETGGSVPLTLEKAKVDPAISSSIFVTMTTDSMGFLVFLGLAVWTGLVG